MKNWKPLVINQPAPPPEHRRVVVPDRAQPCRQAANEVLFLLGFPQTHHCDSAGQFLRLVCLRFSQQPSVFMAEGFLRQQLKRLENGVHRDECRLTVESQLIKIVAAVVLVGSGSFLITKLTMGESPIDNAAKYGNIEAVKQHLDAGANVNAKPGSIEFTPLHYAAREGHKEIAELLIAIGTFVNARSKNKWTPLHLAVDRGHTETADLLRKHGGKTFREIKMLRSR